jgi:hypothetical protein
MGMNQGLNLDMNVGASQQRLGCGAMRHVMGLADGSGYK